MKIVLYISLLFTLNGCANKAEVIKNTNTTRVLSFNDVWKKLTSDKLQKLPDNSVSYFKLTNERQNTILKDAQRTLNNHSDILEPFEKLAHPNGICFKGLWKIDEESNYSGFFQKGSESLIVARLSTALSNTTNDTTRAFGFAGKLFGTTDKDKILKEPTANFFLIDDLGGSDAEYFRDVVLTNEPSVSITMEVLQNFFYALKVSSAFKEADKNPTIRQLYEISELGESKEVITPKWMKISLADNNTTINAKDFRDELSLKENKQLCFTISVASSIKDEHKEWHKIGTITLDSSVVSSSCDHQLHFHHPRFREDLKYTP